MDGSALRQKGHALIEDIPISSEIPVFDALLAQKRGESRRIPPRHELVHRLGHQPRICALIKDFLGAAARPVRAIAFDKTAGRNWAVPWHQDRTIAVDRKDERADVRCWTVKHSVPHCEPPVVLLERMITLRWHFDAMGQEDGCLRILPGSHRLGRLTAPEIARLLAATEAIDICVPAGAVFVMSPLLVHSSRKRTTRGRRRVLHVELAAGDPPAPLNWAWA